MINHANIVKAYSELLSNFKENKSILNKLSEFKNTKELILTEQEENKKLLESAINLIKEYEISEKEFHELQNLIEVGDLLLSLKIK